MFNPINYAHEYHELTYVCGYFFLFYVYQCYN